MEQAQKEYNKLKLKFPDCWIGYNAVEDRYSVYIIPKSWINSLFITAI